MSNNRQIATGCCGLAHRRQFLADMGMGFTGLALGAMLQRHGIVRAAESQSAIRNPQSAILGPHFPPKAKSVIWLFMIGGVSHMESFDPKPALTEYAGQSIKETPYGKAIVDSPYQANRKGINLTTDKGFWPTIFPMQVNYRKFGQSGIEMSDQWQHLGQCIDDVCVIRSMWTEDDNHGAQLQFHTGRHINQGQFPTLGAWAHYGLGSLNENLPQFVVIGENLSLRFGGTGGHMADYLGPAHDGVPISVDPKNPLPFAVPPKGVSRAQQQREFELLGKLNRLSALEYPGDAEMQARIQSYELAFRMQETLPEVLHVERETAATQQMYGLDDPKTEKFGRICLASRRLVERGVRFVQVYDGPANGGGKWDQHGKLREDLAANVYSVDKPIAGLLRDLKQRGLLNETLVCFVTEFGRTPGVQGNSGGSGREHHPFGFSIWLAGGGIKGGLIHGATDELGFHAVENRHYVTDLHATVLHQLGLDSRRLEVPGRKRLDIDHGRPIREIMA